MDRTSKLSSLQADLKSLQAESASSQLSLDILTPVVESVMEIYTASIALTKQFPSCELPFPQFLCMLRASVSVTMEDPDLLRVLKEELVEHTHETAQKQSEASNGGQGAQNAVSNSDAANMETDGATKSDNIMQLTKVLCGVLTLSICNRWPAKPGAFLKLQMVGKMEKNMLNIHDSELSFFHNLLLGNVAPPSWALQPRENERGLPRKQIEGVVYSLLKYSDDFTRATISAGCPWEPNENIADIGGSPIQTLQWLEENYPFEIFEVLKAPTGYSRHKELNDRAKGKVFGFSLHPCSD